MARRSFGKSLKHAWNAFVSDQQSAAIARDGGYSRYFGQSTGFNSMSPRMRNINDKTLLTAILVRMAVDAATVEMKHVRLDGDDQYKEDMNSNLNDCLTVEANIDQGALDFFIDLYMAMFDNGYVAIVPTDTTINPSTGGGWDVLKLRVGEIVDFRPQHVLVSVYNEQTGQRQNLPMSKNEVAVVYNPFYSVMNDGASVLKRLVRKLAILDTVDEASASGKLDMIIQLPYTVRGESKIRQAENRHKLLEDQLENSALGIGYIDATEKVIQLNRPVENSLAGQVEYLIQLLYTQLGLTPEIMNGSADEKTMLNYMTRTIGVITEAVRQSMVRKFLTKTARTQKQSIMTFHDPWKFIPLSSLAELINAVARNEVVTANEIRSKIGFKPHSDPKANMLINSNMPGGNATVDGTESPSQTDQTSQTNQTQSILDQANEIIDNAAAELGVDI